MTCILLCSLAVECPALTLANGNVTVTGINPGDTASYSCDDGYTLEGNETRQCLLTADWSGVDRTCFRESTCVTRNALLFKQVHNNVYLF